MGRAVLVAVVLAAFLAAAPLFAEDKPAASPVKTDEIALEGGTSTASGLALDPTNGRLFVSHGADVDVVDLEKKERIGTVSGVERARGVVVLAEPHRGFVASSKKGRLVAFDADSYEITKELPAGDWPDGVLALPAVREVWVFATRTNKATCIDPVTYETKATIPFEGSPQNGVESKGFVYVTVVNPDSIAVVNVAQHKVIGTHPVTVGAEPEGIAIDAKNGLLLLTCRAGKMAAIETTSWKVASSYDIGPYSGGAAFDPGTSNGFGLGQDRIRVIHVASARSVSLLPSLDSPGGRSCLLDPKTHRLFVACAPPKDEEGPVRVLVFAPKK